MSELIKGLCFAESVILESSGPLSTVELFLRASSSNGVALFFNMCPNFVQSIVLNDFLSIFTVRIFWTNNG